MRKVLLLLLLASLVLFSLVAAPVKADDGKEFPAGQPVTFKVTATNPSGGTLRFSASDLPDGATLDPITGVFSWTPTHAQIGVWVIRFTVSDGQLSDYEDVTITVTARGADSTQVTAITSTPITAAATFNGILYALGSATTVQVSFEYGTTLGYGQATPDENMTSPGPYSYRISTLALKTVYHFRAKAVGDGTAYGDDMTFQTPLNSYDVNDDWAVNVLDLISVVQHLNEPNPAGLISQDANADGTVNILDLILVAQNLFQ